MKILGQFLQLTVPFFWLGLIVGLWFTQNGIVILPVAEIGFESGLDAEGISFSILKQFEIVLAFLLSIAVYYWRPKVLQTIVLTWVLLVLGMQTLWLLPVLNERVSIIVPGEAIERLFLQTLFTVFELLKVIGLLAFGLWVFRDLLKTQRLADQEI